jgi:methylaspartate ammonia-lyase
MTRITDVIFAPADGAFFYDDQLAIRSGVEKDGIAYAGTPLTAGFSRVRMPASALSIGLVLDDGHVAWGDMVSVQYSGAAGRDPLFQREQIAARCERDLVPRLIGLEAADVARNCATAFDATGEPLPVAARYGASQALLSAAAHARQLIIAELVSDIFDMPPPCDPVPVFAQSGDDRYDNVDKMVLKGVDILPHGLINSREKFGPDGASFLEYMDWAAKRTQELGQPGYRPTLHFDFYGWIGLGISDDPAAVADFIARAADMVKAFDLHIESPADYGSRAAQIENFAKIIERLGQLGCAAKLVADEHCNTLDDVRAFCDAKAAHIIQVKTPDVGSLLDTAAALAYAKQAGIGAYCGGTSAETDLSARTCVHVALAMQASMMLAKPGMGVDEGICIVRNEQSRILAQMRHKYGAKGFDQ